MRKFISFGLVALAILMTYLFASGRFARNRTAIKMVFSNREYCEARVKNISDQPIYDVVLEPYRIAEIAPSDGDNPSIERKIPVEIRAIGGFVTVLEPHQSVTFTIATPLGNLRQDSVNVRYGLSPGGIQHTDSPIWRIATGPDRD